MDRRQFATFALVSAGLIAVAPGTAAALSAAAPIGPDSPVEQVWWRRRWGWRRRVWRRRRYWW